MLTLDQVMTLTEAADKWGYSDGSTIRKAIERGRFKEHEIKRSGRVWLLTYEAMCRVFGEPQVINGTILLNIKEFMQCVVNQEITTDDTIVLNTIEQIYSSLNDQKSVILLGENGETIIKLDSVDEANIWLRRMRYAFNLSQSMLKKLNIL